MIRPLSTSFRHVDSHEAGEATERLRLPRKAKTKTVSRKIKRATQSNSNEHMLTMLS